MGNYIHFGAQCCQKYVFYEKKFQIKVVQNRISSKKVHKRICLSTPRVELRCVYICMRTQTRQAEARHARTDALIATWGKMLSFAEPVSDSLWSTDSRRIAFVRPQTEQRPFSSPRLGVHIATHALPRPASRAFLYQCGRSFRRLRRSVCLKS